MSTFWLLTALFLGSTGADILTTRAALARCPSCVEANPLARPFVRHDAALVIYVTIPTAAVIGVSARAHRERVPAWWIPMAVLTAGHVILAVSNARLPGSPR
jgi:hypothetical protein